MDVTSVPASSFLSAQKATSDPDSRRASRFTAAALFLEAGRELGISPRTIEVHRARVMEKLGARNTADLMRIVFDK